MLSFEVILDSQDSSKTKQSFQAPVTDFPRDSILHTQSALSHQGLGGHNALSFDNRQGLTGSSHCITHMLLSAANSPVLQALA